MKILLVGVGGVGEAMAMIARPRPWIEQLILADYNLERVKEVQSKLGDGRRFPIEKVDATYKEQIEALASRYKVDLIMNACDPLFNVSIFEAAFDYGCNYMDMAMTLSEPHPTDPFTRCGVKLGDYQFDRARQWEQKGLLALVGLGVEPGMADVFARYAQDYLFDEIDEIVFTSPSCAEGFRRIYGEVLPKGKKITVQGRVTASEKLFATSSSDGI